MKWEACEFQSVKTMEEYLASLTAPIDSFLEDHIRTSQFYRVWDGEADIGHFAVHGGSLLTQFYLRKPFRHHATELLAEIRSTLSITEAFVPTADSFLLSLTLDMDAPFIKQAIFWEDARDPTLPTLAQKLEYRQAIPTDAEAIREMSGDFLDHLEQRIADGQIFVGLLTGVMVAVGIIERSHFWQERASIGMFTREAERGQGVGTATLLYLKRVCYKAEIQPIAGCYYYNDPSRHTLTAAGMIPSVRLLRFKF